LIFRFSDKRKTALATSLLIIMLALSSFMMLVPTVKAALLDPSDIPKFTNQLTGPPPVYTPKMIKNPNGPGVAMYYEITMDESSQQILPTVDENGDPTGFGMTDVWGYGGNARDAMTGKPLGYVLNSPGPSFEAVRGIPTVVKWINEIDTSYMFAVDPTLHWTNPNNIPKPDDPLAPTAPFPTFPPGFDGTVDAVTNPYGYDAQSPVPLVTHLHGGEVQSYYDGGPDAWTTYDGVHGPAYSSLYPTESNAAVYYYPNEQPAATLWYHDHGLGVTRLNVMSGLAGYYFLRDPQDVLGHKLDAQTYEMPIVIQDRIFQDDGNFYFPIDPPNPTVHPYWGPEFFGDTIMVNGLVWPNMDVNRGVYRFRLLDGSNARFYTLSFVANPGTVDEVTLPFIQIGTDGGYIKAPVTMTELTIAPGERADVLVDFSGLPAGTKVLMKNTANAPFPDGDPVDDNTAQIMQFTVTKKKMATPLKLPEILNSDLDGGWPTLPAPDNTRVLTLWEVQGPGGPLEVLVNGQKWAAPVSEDPEEGSTEEWVIVNLTGDTHPIHTHLTQFQLVGRYTLTDPDAYAADWTALNGGDPPYYDTPDELNPFDNGYIVSGSFVGPAPNEYAWKDTIQMNPGEVTVIRIRFAPIDGTPSYPFDPTMGPGYVWHCHILDHEDNEMMRPYVVS
jgi:spore coat protein A